MPVLEKLDHDCIKNRSLKAKSTQWPGKFKSLVMNQIFQAPKGTYYDIFLLTNTMLPSHTPFVSFSEDEVLQQLKKHKEIFLFYNIANVFVPRNRSHFELWPS